MPNHLLLILDGKKISSKVAVKLDFGKVTSAAIKERNAISSNHKAVT